MKALHQHKISAIKAPAYLISKLGTIVPLD